MRPESRYDEAECLLKERISAARRWHETIHTINWFATFGCRQEYGQRLHSWKSNYRYCSKILDDGTPDWHSSTPQSVIKHFVYNESDPKNFYVFHPRMVRPMPRLFIAPLHQLQRSTER